MLQCVVTFFGLVACYQPQMQPDAKIIHMPPPTAEDVAREAEWTRICEPTIRIGPDGIGRYRYGPACPNGIIINRDR